MKTPWLHLLIMIFFCLPLKHFGQTVSKKDNPNWTNSADWTLGVPLNSGQTTQNVELNNNSNINFVIKIHNIVTINAGKRLTTNSKIEISKGGKLIVYGQVTILDENLELKDDGSLIIMDGGYFEGGGKGEFKLNGDGFHLAEGGKLSWDGKFTIDDQKASVKIDGELVAKELKNQGTIKGNGSIEVLNKLENDGIIFDCTKKQCCASFPCLLGTSQIDDEPPVFISCPDNILEIVLASANTRVVTWILPVVQDNVGVTSLTSNYGLLHSFPIGTTTVTYVATDVAGNSSTCSFNVTILDKEAPVFTNCPADITEYCDAGSSGAVISWQAPAASDNDAIATFTSNYESGDFFDVGKTVVTYTATDKSGNTSSCSFQVFVIENAVNAPVFSNCPADQLLNTQPADSFAIASWTSPLVSGGVGIVNIVSSHSSGQKFYYGTTNIFYEATDEAGNKDYCSFQVVVNDNEKPKFVLCPYDIVAYAIQDGCSARVYWPELQYSDNVKVTGVESNKVPGDLYEVGTTKIEYKIYDKAGNFESCKFNVEVIDTISPSMVCPPDQVFYIGSEFNGTVVTFREPIVSDNCGIKSLKRTDDLKYESGDFFPRGEYILSYEAIDINNNSSFCNTKIFIETIVPAIDVVATDDHFVIQEDHSVSLDVLQNDLVSIAGEKLFISSILKAPIYGIAEIVNDKIDYRPNQNFAGRDVLAYQVCAVSQPDQCSRGNVEIDIVEIKDAPFLIDYSYNVNDRGLVNLCLEKQDAENHALIINNIIEKPEIAEIVSIDSGQLCLDFTTDTGIQRFLIEVCDNGEPRECINVELEFMLEIQIRLRVYKGISPNGDGYNDLWIIDGIDQFPDNTIRVFDRWGKLVYSVDNYNNEDRVWDGNANVGGGKILPNGSYFYRIDVEGKEMLKGYVELLK
jgi:gliding motility-associated-like protein